MKLILITEGNPNEYGLEIVINTFGLASTYVKDGEYIIRTQKGTKAMLYVGLRVYFINAKTYHLTDVTGDGKHIGNADVKTIIDTLCGKCVLTNIPDKTKKRVCRLSAMWENAMYDIRNLAREWFHNDTDKLCSVFVDGIITPLLRECIILSKIYLQAMSLQ